MELFRLPDGRSAVHYTGRQFNRRIKGASAADRAMLAEALRRGHVVVTDFTGAQAQRLANASDGYTSTVHRLSEAERAAVRNHHHQICEFHYRPPSDLVLERASPERLLAVLDRKTAPANAPTAT